ncbi:hypothetical protein [Streptomyces sp. NBC_00212]|uniref:hypothetical protein n=1 Tax=Streptomyces sp. NBC_00212 TaxID=2975684 RepID=UPI003254A8A5
MYKFTGPAVRAALVAGLVSALGTGYAAYAADHPAPVPPHDACDPHSGAGKGKGHGPGNGPEAAPRQHYAHSALAGRWGEEPPASDGTEESGSGQEMPWSPAPTGTPPKHTPTPTPTAMPTWGTQSPTAWPTPSPSGSTPPTGPPSSPPDTWTSTPTPTYPSSTPPEETPTAPAPSPSASAPPHLAHTGADSKASLLGALSAGAIVTGAAAVALTRRASRGKCEK